VRQKTILMNNGNGLHIRPASEVADSAAKFESEITLTNKGRTVNAKSIVNVMTLAVEPGEEITIIAIGTDEERAIAELGRLISQWED
jgi:phosphotransferase system HPr (HPr) family protein